MATPSANELFSQNPQTQTTGTSVYALDVSSAAEKKTSFTLTMGANAFGANGWYWSAGPNFTKGTYSLPAAATLTITDNTTSAVYDVNETSATAYNALLRRFSEIPCVISGVYFEASNQSDISGNSFLVTQYDSTTLSNSNPARYRLSKWFRPADFITGVSAYVNVGLDPTKPAFEVAVNQDTFFVLENGISINESGQFDVYYRASGGQVSLMSPVSVR